jgi:SAM-dependent methyltransferase
MSCDFDYYADTYDVELRKATAFAGRDPKVFTEAKAKALIDVARERLRDLSTASALDVGCGVGNIHEALEPQVAKLHGIDVSPRAVDVARSAHPGVEYRSYDGIEFPYPSDTFDLVFAICVLHHVPPTGWRSFVGEMARTVRPGGLVVIIEHNRLNPLTRLVTLRCAFDEDIVLVGRRRAEELMRDSRLRQVESDYVLFSPWRGGTIERIEHHLRWFPLGAQYMTYGSAK